MLEGLTAYEMNGDHGHGQSKAAEDEAKWRSQLVSYILFILLPSGDDASWWLLRLLAGSVRTGYK